MVMPFGKQAPIAGVGVAVGVVVCAIADPNPSIRLAARVTAPINLYNFIFPPPAV
jgi:hypothetical protein